MGERGLRGDTGGFHIRHPPRLNWESSKQWRAWLGAWLSDLATANTYQVPTGLTYARRQGVSMLTEVHIWRSAAAVYY